MNVPQTHIEALGALGYTEGEARFLYLVATHSGYFVARQFRGFTGSRWGSRTTRLCRKLQAARHARTYGLANGGTVHHLFSRTVYRQIGRENLRNGREHQLEYIRQRVATLDFVLGHPDHHYLETEADRVAFFCTELQLPSYRLPSRSYIGRSSAKPAVRYFVERFPMFFPATSDISRVVTFTYIQDDQATLAGFVHHLRLHLPLFGELPRFRFLFLATTNARFARAARLFRDLVTIPLEPNPSGDLLRYFAIRKAWESAQYASLTEGDLIFRNLARERFDGARFESFYRAWKAGSLADGEIRTHLGGSDRPHAIEFAVEILRAIGSSDPGPEPNR